MDTGAVETYRRKALAVTVSRAARHEFYREKYGPHSEGLRNFIAGAHDEFRALPIVTKAELHSSLQPLIPSGDQIQTIIHTTGSTGPVTYRYRSNQELEQIAAFGASEVERVRAGKHRPMALMIYGPYHGQNLPQPTAAQSVAPFFFAGAVWDDIFLRQSRDLLCKEFSVPGLEKRVTQLHGAVRLLRIFTQCMIDMGLRRSDTAIESVVSFAGYLPSEARAFLSDFWEVEPVDMFSMSEILGGAAKCPACGALEFPPHILAEAVELAADEPLASGVGRLVVTELFPFGQTQPLVRFYNGDLVRTRSDDCSRCGGGPRMVHVGRDNESVMLPDGCVLLASSDLREAAYCEVVGRTTEFPHLKLLVDRDTHLGAPFIGAGVGEGPNSVRIRFRPKVSADRDPGRCSEILRQRLLDASPELKAAVDDGACLELIADHGFDEILWK